MFPLALTLASALALLPSVAAHGVLTKIVIDGQSYTGNFPNANPTNSPIRQVADIRPVKGASNPDLNCGLSAQLAAMVVPANPGSVLEFYWGDPGNENWPHNTGPMMMYMAPCDTSTCDKFNGSSAKWFKIDQIGRKPDGVWYQQDVMNGSFVSVTLPTDVAAGQYLVRHEIIALHLAVNQGGAEFYPSCTQIEVGGSQTGTPDQTVSFPGAYSDNDPGIYDPNVFDTSATYIFPGPPVSNLASPADMSTTGGENTGDVASSDVAAPSTAASTGAHKPSGTSTGSTGTSTAQPTQTAAAAAVCRLKKRDATQARRRSLAMHKRRPGFFRAIRDAILHS